MTTRATEQPSTGGRKKALLLGVVLMLLAGSVGYNVWRSRADNPVPVKPKLSDIVMRWRCLGCGHETEGPVARGPHACSKCGKNEMYVSCRFQCRKHGSKDVAIQYTDKERIELVKVGQKDWAPYIDANHRPGTVCDECGESMAGVEMGRRTTAEVPEPGG